MLFDRTGRDNLGHSADIAFVKQTNSYCTRKERVERWEGETVYQRVLVDLRGIFT